MKIDEIQKRLISSRIGEDQNKEIVITSELFEKAITEFGWNTYNVDALNTYKRELVKAFAQKRLSKDELEKAQKDLAKLRKISIINKKGDKQTVYVDLDKDKKTEKKVKKEEPAKKAKLVPKVEKPDKEGFSKVEYEEEKKEVKKEEPKKEDKFSSMKEKMSKMKRGEEPKEEKEEKTKAKSNPENYWNRLNWKEKSKLVSSAGTAEIWKHAKYSEMPKKLQEEIKNKMKDSEHASEVLSREYKEPVKSDLTAEKIKEDAAAEHAKTAKAEAERRKLEVTTNEKGEVVSTKKKEEKKIEYAGEQYVKGDEVNFSVDKSGKTAIGKVVKHGKDKLGEFVKIECNGKMFIRYPHKISKVGAEKKVEEHNLSKKEEQKEKIAEMVKQVDKEKIKEREKKEKGDKFDYRHLANNAPASIKDKATWIRHLANNAPASIKDKATWIKAISHLTKDGKKVSYAAVTAVYNAKLKQQNK